MSATWWVSATPSETLILDGSFTVGAVTEIDGRIAVVTVEFD